MALRYYVSSEEAPFFVNNKMGSSDRIPTSGTYKVGDFIISNTQADGIFGWVCTVAGTPGTWIEIGSGGGSNTKTLSLSSSTVVSSPVREVAIGIKDFNKTTDFLMVYKNSTYLTEGVDYNISSDSTKIVSRTGNWNADSLGDYRFSFVVIKEVEKVSPEAVVGTENIKDSVVTMTKLGEDVIERLDGFDSQLEHIVNVLDKYVVNDGITDNTDIIQNALDNSNYIRISKKGTYITRRLIIHDNTTFELADGVILKQKDNNSDYIIVNDKWENTDGSYNTNIKIIGGHYDINGVNNPRTGNIIDGLYAGIGIVLNNVRNLEVRNIKEIGNALKYCFLVANIENGLFENINCINESDGLHFQAPCKNIEVTNLTGTCHDNLLPFTIGDYPAVVLSENGDFDNINIKNIYSKGETIDVIRFVGNGKNGIGTFRNITIDNVEASCPNTGVIEIFNSDQASPNDYLKATYIENIKISNVRNNSQTKRGVINVFGKVDLLTIDNIKQAKGVIDNRIIALFRGSDVGVLNINNCEVTNDNQSSTQLIFEQGNPIININNSKFKIKGNLIKFVTDNVINVNISNCDINCNKMFVANGTGNIIFKIDNTLIANTNSSDLLDSINMTMFADTTTSPGEGLKFNNSTSGLKRLVTSTLKTNLSESSLTPTIGDYCLFNGNVKYYTIRNRWCNSSKEYIAKYIGEDTLNFGTIPANSFIELEVDILSKGLPTGLNYDNNYSLIVNLYNAGGVNQGLLYTYYAKLDKVYIRMFNLSTSEKTIKSDAIIRFIGN